MGPALVVALVLAVAALGAVLLAGRRRERALAAQLAAITARLEHRGPGGEPDAGAALVAAELGGAVARLQGQAESAAEQASTADAVRRRLELALDAVPEGLVVTDEQGRAVYRNAVAATYRDARHADALVAAALDELVADAVVGRGGERTLELFGPPRRTLVVSATPLASGAGPAGALAVIEDVTERRRLDEVRRDFVANISHELKTPVGALSLLAETLLSEDDPALVRRLAERMLGEADRVADTIEDLLALTHIETESARSRQEVAVADVVADAVARTTAGAEQRHVRIDVTPVPPELTVVGDRRQLVSALSNLLDNAVKYSDEHAVVTVAAATVAGSVELSVEDHGMGIPARDLERVFERFYRVDVARHRATGGTGLGLAIVRHVAQNHDGEVRVASRLGEGSTFTLRLPADRGVPGRAPGPGGPATVEPAATDDDDDGAGPSDRRGREANQDGDQEHLGAAGGGRGLLRRGVDRRVAT